MKLFEHVILQRRLISLGALPLNNLSIFTLLRHQLEPLAKVDALADFHVVQEPEPFALKTLNGEILGQVRHCIADSRLAHFEAQRLDGVCLRLA